MENNKEENNLTQSNYRIMLVEDNNILAMGMKAMLAKLGHEVVSIEKNGSEAISNAIQLKPDVIFIDIYLKDNTTGIKVVEELQNKIDAEFIYVTGNTDPDHLNQAKYTRHLDYLVKPVSLQVIKDTLARVKKSA